MISRTRNSPPKSITASRRTAMSHSEHVHSAAHFLLKPSVLVAALAGIFATPAALAFNSGSTGTDGALAPTVNTVIQVPESGILNYTTVNIPAGVTVKFKKNTLNTPVYVLVSSTATIAGTLDLNATDSKDAGTYGDGNLTDDGIPGVGGPGGFDGGRGGRDDQSLRPEIIRGGAGLGPGGGLGSLEQTTRCTSGRWYPPYPLGASYATKGSNYNFGACDPAGDATAKPYGSNTIQPLIGGSGGGGGLGGTNYPGSGGGGGGGAILIAVSGTLNIPSGGMISASGGNAGGSDGVGGGTFGAGGSGGAIRLMATTIAGAGALNAFGGCISQNGSNRQYCGINGFGGSDGRIRLETETNTFNGASLPVYTVDTPGPVFLTSIPSLRIASVAGSPVPANPTGNADVTLPATIANPVAVNFETTNVPTGNTVLLRVIPAYGNVVEALSPAVVGTTAAGTASVNVNLPQGPSVLQATTTYTVVVAMGDALSRFAQNERVEKVQLIASLGGQGQAKLITVSGKEYLVPMSVLQMVGFTG
jgi:hypothetical protein